MRVWQFSCEEFSLLGTLRNLHAEKKKKQKPLTTNASFGWSNNKDVLRYL